MEYKVDHGACIPLRVHTIVISVQHSEDITLEAMRKSLLEDVVKQVIPAKYLDKDTVYHLQPSGSFVVGGPKVRELLNYDIIVHWLTSVYSQYITFCRLLLYFLAILTQ